MNTNDFFRQAVPNSDFIEVIERLFNSSWLCETTKVCLSLLQEVPKTLDIFEVKAPALGSFKNITGVTRSEVCSNEDGIIAMLYGVSKSGVGEEYQAFTGITPIEKTNLSTASLAELVYRKGTVTLVNPTDSVAIYNDIGRYLNILSVKQAVEPHYQPPPEEDINAFRNLYNLLDSLAYSYESTGGGETALAKLQCLSSGITSNVRYPAPEKIILNGNRNTIKYGLENADFYKFNRE